MKTVSYPAPCIFRPMTDDRLLAVAYEVTVYAKGAVKVFDVGSWKVRYDLATAFTMVHAGLSGQSSPCFLRLPQ
ncbi:MAG TPA: hypothetical protein VN833_22100 [Candidatus Acidoferrales bacterium]|nr:hypothetical protein [Candidatus Acidoferrales bacterium]